MTEIKTRNGSFPSSDYIQTARCPSGPVVISTYRVAPSWLCVRCLTFPPERTQPRRATAENRNGLNTIKGVDQSVIVNADLSTPLNPILILVRLFRNFLHVRPCWEVSALERLPWKSLHLSQLRLLSSGARRTFIAPTKPPTGSLGGGRAIHRRSIKSS